jgi:hypothetical protein
MWHNAHKKILENPPSHSRVVHNKLHENPYSHSRVIFANKRTSPKMTVKADDVITHAQRIVCNILIVPTDDFERPLRWYYQLLEIEKACCGPVSNGTTSVTNFMKIRLAILELLRTDGHHWTFLKDDVITQAQRIMGNGILIGPPHDFEHSSLWYYQLQENKNIIVD